MSGFIPDFYPTSKEQGSVAAKMALFVVSTWVGPWQNASAAIIITLLVILWVVDYFKGHTFWLAVRWETYAFQLAYLAGLIFIYAHYPNQNLFQVLCAPFFLLTLNSAAIANSRRWIGMLACMGISLYGCWLFNGRVQPPSDLVENIAYQGFLYALIPGFACLARLFFPRTKHLIHTSLDYPPVRLEVLSFGMKRPAAIGIKKL